MEHEGRQPSRNSDTPGGSMGRRSKVPGRSGRAHVHRRKRETAVTDRPRLSDGEHMRLFPASANQTCHISVTCTR